MSNHTVSYGYDSMNRLTNRVDQLARVEVYRYDKNGNVTNFVDRRSVSVSFKYDPLDRRTGIVYAAESNVGLFYDKVGRVTNVVDSIAGSTRLTYDTLDRLTQVVDINGTLAYGYNDVGLRTNMTVTGETAVAYKYDAVNRLTNVVQGTYASSLFYDDAGRRTNLTLPNGVKVLYRYDTASRLTNLMYQAAVTNKIDYVYDETGNRAAQASALAIYNLPSAISTSQYNVANQQLPPTLLLATEQARTKACPPWCGCVRRVRRANGRRRAEVDLLISVRCQELVLATEFTVYEADCGNLSILWTDPFTAYDDTVEIRQEIRSRRMRNREIPPRVTAL